MKLFGKELFGKIKRESTPSVASTDKTAATKTESGAAWYIAIDSSRHFTQVVLNLPNSNAVPSEFGILTLSTKYLSLLSSNWVSGFFRMEGKSTPYFLIRADNGIDEFKICPTKIAFTFFRTSYGGIFAIYIYVDSQALRAKRSQRHVFIEIGNGLDVSEYVQLVQDVFKSDPITVILASGSDSIASLLNVSGAPQEYVIPQCRYDIRLPLEPSCRETLLRELEGLISFHASVPAGQRNVKQSMNEVWSIMPETENPVLPQQTQAPLDTAVAPKPPSGPTSASQKIEPTKTPAASYVESVFNFDLVETSESRDWRRLDELKDVPDLFHDKKFPQVEARLNAALTQFPDYHFVFSWQASVFEEKGEIERARQAYAEGIRVSKQKNSLCGHLAMLEFKHGTLKEAVRWWIRSILLQMQSKSVDDAQSFLYLAFVALLNQQNDASSKLMAASAKGMHGTIALSHQGKQNVSQKVNSEPYDEIRSAIKELTTRRWTGF